MTTRRKNILQTVCIVLLIMLVSRRRTFPGATGAPGVANVGGTAGRSVCFNRRCRC